MRRGFVLIAVCCVTLAVAASAASAQNDPTVTVTPDTGLVDGQTVSVQGSGFDPSTLNVGVAQCPVEATSPVDCVGHTVVSASSGSFATTFMVRRFVLGIDCASVPRRCYVGASNLNGLPVFTEQATALLTFAGSVPQTKDDCKRGGWQTLADDHGQPFRNQGQCVSFVVHGP